MFAEIWGISHEEKIYVIALHMWHPCIYDTCLCSIKFFPTKSPYFNVKYTDFVNKVSNLLETGVFHTSLSPLQYDPDLSKDGFASYFSSTPSRVMVGFFVKNDHVSFIIATLNVNNKKMMQDAMEIMGAACLAMGMTPDELKKLFDLKPYKGDELLGRSYCAKSDKIVTLLADKDEELLSISLFAQDL